MYNIMSKQAIGSDIIGMGETNMIEDVEKELKEDKENNLDNEGSIEDEEKEDTRSKKNRKKTGKII